MILQDQDNKAEAEIEETDLTEKNADVCAGIGREGKKMEKMYCPEKAVVDAGRIKCPYCGGFIGNAYYGAFSGNVELKCSNGRCKKFCRLEL